MARKVQSRIGYLGMVGRFQRSLLAAAVVGLPLKVLNSEARAVTLTGAVISAPHETGPDWEVLDTSPGNGGWNLWVCREGSFINGPSDAEAAIRVPLTSGTYTFEVYGQPTLLRPTWRLNLFFDGNTTSPGISAYSDLDVSLTDNPPFFVNSSLVSVGLNSTIVSPAGTLTYTSGELNVILSDFVWASPVVNDLDVVGTYTRPPADGPDFFGRFSVVVTPEPASLGLLGLGLASIVARRRRLA